MSYSPVLSSSFNRTKLRDPAHVSPFSGMCSMCTADCVGTCEIGISAVRGADAVYPTTTGENQVASEKTYPVDYSHFNISGRVFGAIGAAADAELTTIKDVNLETQIGTLNPVKLKMPIILPALVKLNWQDYYAGAAMAGVLTVIGEGAVTKDPTLKIENGKVTHCPKLREFLDAFRKYDRGYGQIILQVNVDDDRIGVPEYAIKACGCRRMSVNHCTDVISFFVAAKMHLDFRRRFISVCCFQYICILVNFNYLFRSNKALADSCRSCKEITVFKFHGNISVIGCNPT